MHVFSGAPFSLSHVRRVHRCLALLETLLRKAKELHLLVLSP